MLNGQQDIQILPPSDASIYFFTQEGLVILSHEVVYQVQITLGEDSPDEHISSISEEDKIILKVRIYENREEGRALQIA